MTRLHRSLWLARALAALVGLGGIAASSQAFRDRRPPAAFLPPVGRSEFSIEVPPARDSLIRLVIDGNLFEASRRSAAVRFGYTPPPVIEAPPQTTPPAETTEPAPLVTLKGLMEGEPPMAILSVGDDSIDRLVGANGNVGSLTVLSVGKDGVRLQWGDSIWTVRPGGTP